MSIYAHWIMWKGAIIIYATCNLHNLLPFDQPLAFFGSIAISQKFSRRSYGDKPVWDDELSLKDQQTRSHFRKDIVVLNKLKINRQIFDYKTPDSIKLQTLWMRQKRHMEKKAAVYVPAMTKLLNQDHCERNLG